MRFSDRCQNYSAQVVSATMETGEHTISSVGNLGDPAAISFPTYLTEYHKINEGIVGVVCTVAVGEHLWRQTLSSSRPSLGL